MSAKTHYDTLGVPADATTGQIRHAYLSLMRVAHPDQGGSADQAAAITTAYDILSDATRRADYDAQLVGNNAAREGGVDEPEDLEVVDDWGAEVPQSAPPTGPHAGFRPPPPPSFQQPPPGPPSGYPGPPPGYRPPPGYPGPMFHPGPQRPGGQRPKGKARLARRFWPAGSGALTWAARMLTAIVSLVVVLGFGLQAVGVALGQGSPSQVGSDFLTLGLVTLLYVGPSWRRSMGGRIHWEYVFFIIMLVGGPLGNR